MTVPPSELLTALRYLLGVELFDHRLQCLLRLPAAPAKTTQTESKQLVKETVTFIKTQKGTEIHRGAAVGA